MLIAAFRPVSGNATVPPGSAERKLLLAACAEIMI
jgi:hypothetical protein